MTDDAVVELIIWVVGLCAGIWFFGRPFRCPRLDLKMIGLTAVLAAVLAPLYLVALDDHPARVTGDEIHYLSYWIFDLRTMFANPFGLFHGWWDLPRATWILPYFLSRLAGHLGDQQITLSAMRFAHSMFGFLSILICFALYAQVMRKRWAFLAALLLGTQHVMWVSSRYASIDNIQMVALAASFDFAVRARRDNSTAAAFASGIASGAEMYFNFPGRLVIFVVGLFYAVRKASLKRILLPWVAGAILISWPVVYSIASNFPEAQKYAHQRSLLYREGREYQRSRLGLYTQFEGVVANIHRGLTMYNSRTPDTWNLFTHPRLGFLDQLSGILLWLGIATTFITFDRQGGGSGGPPVRRMRLKLRLSPTTLSDVDLILMINFWSYYLALAFVANLAPVYGRAILTLPAVLFFVTRALERICKSLPKSGPVAAVVLAAFILQANIAGGLDHMQVPYILNEPTGKLFRYVRKNYRHRDIFVVCDHTYRITEWSVNRRFEQNYIRNVLEAAAGERLSDRLQLVMPRDLPHLPSDEPLSLILSEACWEEIKPQVIRQMPSSTSTHVMPLSPVSITVEFDPEVEKSKPAAEAAK